MHAIANYEKALKLGQVLVAYARIMMVGPGGVGKSSLLHALMNKLLPLANSTQLADLLTVKPQREQQSTTEQLLVSATDDEKPWVKVTEDDEINELVGLVSTRGKCFRRFNKIFTISAILEKSSILCSTSTPLNQ